MSITNIQTLHDLAETSLACYTYLDDKTKPLLADMLQRPALKGSFTPDQAKTFADKYALLSVCPNESGSGFSATVFQDKNGLKVLALRGTEANVPGQILPDLVMADIGGIGGNGYGQASATLYDPDNTIWEDRQTQLTIRRGQVAGNTKHNIYGSDTGNTFVRGNAIKNVAVYAISTRSRGRFNNSTPRHNTTKHQGANV